jgi:hypothetical protein
MGTNMGFICNFCAKPQLACTPAHKVVTLYKEFNHPCRPKAATRVVVKNGKNKTEYVTDPGGMGLQIEKEVLACPSCALEWDRKQKEKQLALGGSGKQIIPMPKLVVNPLLDQRPRRFNEAPKPFAEQKTFGKY